MAVKKSSPGYGLRCYGYIIPPNIGAVNQLDMELRAFAEGRTEEQGGLGKGQHFKNILELVYPWVFKHWHDWNELMLWAWCNYEEIGLSGCVAGSTRILNPITGEQPTIQYLHENRIAPIVMTRNGPELAMIPVKKEETDLFEVVLENGSRFEAAAFHRVMLNNGSFSMIEELEVGNEIGTYDSVHLLCDKPQKIVSISKTQRDVYYDMTVPLSHHYFAEGAVHHNCGSAHKTFTNSLLGMMEFVSSPSNTAVIMSSKTVPSLRTRLWAQIKKFWIGAGFSDNEKRLNPIAWPYNIVDSKTTIQFRKGDDFCSIRAVAVDSGTTEMALGKIIGSHPGRVIMMVDEAAQTKPAIFSARANLAIGAKFFRFVALANAVDQFDAHGKFCEPKQGWSTITVDSESWETKTGICLHFDGMKSPNVLAGEDKYPNLFNLRAIEKIRNDHGEDSLEWWSQCRGFWAPSGTRNTVLDASMIISGRARESVFWEKDVEQFGSLDPAFTTGGDRCILRFSKFGKFINGTMGMQLTELIHIKLSDDGRVPINYQIADRVREECEKRKVPPENFCADVTSASGLADIISQRWSPNFQKLQFGGAPDKVQVSPNDTRLATDVYANRVTWLWFLFQRMVMDGRVRGLDDDTAQEFCSRQYALKGEKVCVESKADMKLRTNGVSPDLADPCAEMAYMFNRRHGIDGAAVMREKLQEDAQLAAQQNWKTLQRRHNVQSKYAA